MGGHRPSIGSAQQVNANDTTDVSNTTLNKNSFSSFCWGLLFRNGEVEDCTTSDLQKIPTAVVQPQGREIFSTFGNRLVFAVFRWGNLCATVPSKISCQKESARLKRGAQVKLYKLIQPSFFLFLTSA
jgi:hypothetical protein